MDEKALDAAQWLYELFSELRSAIYLDNSSGAYKVRRLQLVTAVGRDALPEFLRDGRTVYEAYEAVVLQGGDRRAVVRAAFDPIFAQLETPPKATPKPVASPTRPVVSSGSAPPIFLSHSSEDLELAQAVVDLLTFSMRLAPEVIRCTSVPGHDLRGGERTDDRLRQEIAGAEILLALITPKSLRSAYVLFELGARWGLVPDSDDPPRFIPLIGRGIESGKVPRPLSDFNCLDLRLSEDIAHLTDSVSKVMKTPLVSEAARGRHVKRVIEAASDLPTVAQFDAYERRMLRALFDEEHRLLEGDRKDPRYSKAIASLIEKQLVRDERGKLRLSRKGREATAAYLASLL